MNNHLINPQELNKVTEVLLFRTIWSYSEKKSFISNLWLREFFGTIYFVNCFAHILAKGQNKYPYFKSYARNVVLLHPKEHFLLDHGSEEQRIQYALDVEEKGGKCDWQKLKDLELELQKEYKLHFPTTRGIMIGVKYNLWEVMAKIGVLNKEFFEGRK
jgi:hypothetical protein